MAWLSGYSHRRKITIDNTKVDSTLTDFPVLVKLTSANFDFSQANSDGFDIKFCSNDGETLLKYERERHDSANELAEYWVKVPSVSDSADTYIYLYYRTADTADGADPENVWDSNFKAVHHLKDNTTSSVLDSTSNNNDGTKKAANEPVEATGKIAKGQDFDGTDDYIYLTNCQNATEGTFEGWIKYDTLATYSRLMMDVSGYFTLGMGGTYNNQMQFAIYDSDGNLRNVLDDDTFTTGSWLYAVGTYKGGEKVKLYVGGELKKESADAAAAGGLQNVSEQIRIGRAGDVRYFDGLIDEVRISNVARSAAWIKASYNSGNNSLLSIGADDEPSASVSPSFSPSISESSSISASLSESISPSLSESVSSSISPSISESSSISASISPSLSASISISISPSLSPSSSPSIGYQEYTKGDYVELPAGADDLTSSYTEQNYIDVSSINDVFVGQDTSYNYTIHQFKEYCGSSDICTLTCVCKTNFLPSLSPVYLQIYNRDTSSWETVATNNTANVNTSFTLSANIFGLSDYKDENTVIACRVYQQG